MQVSDETLQAAAEILAWKRTGILPGDNLRKIARSIQAKLGSVFDMGQAIQMAEEQVKREALEYMVTVNGGNADAGE